MYKGIALVSLSFFRCFIYEKTAQHQGSYLLAQSGDATCNGLNSVQEGSRTIKLSKGLYLQLCSSSSSFV